MSSGGQPGPATRDPHRRLAEQLRRDHELFRQAQRHLASVLEPEPPPPPPLIEDLVMADIPAASRDEPGTASTSAGGAGAELAGASRPLEQGRLADDPLLAACRAVGEALGIPIEAPPSSYPEGSLEGSPGHRLQRICDASGVRHRNVLLREGWWRRDHGPLLAFRAGASDSGAARSPVALLPSSPRRYRMLDPASGRRCRVTPAVAAALAPRAVQLYPPLPARPLSPLDLFRHAFRRSGRDLASLVVAGFAAALMALLTPIVIGWIFGRLLPEGNRAGLGLVTLALVGAALAAAGFQVVRGLAVLRIGGRVDGVLQTAVWDRLLSLPIPFFRRYSVGDLSQRMVGIDDLRQLLVGPAITSLLSAVFALASFALLFYYSIPLALVATALVLLLALVTARLSLLQIREQQALLDEFGRVAGLVLGFLRGIAKLRVAAAEGRAYARWAAAVTAQRRRAVASQRLANLQTVASVTYALLSALVLFAVMGIALAQRLPVSDFLAFHAAYGQFQVAALSSIEVLGALLNVIPLSRRLRPILQQRPEVAPSQRAAGRLEGEVELRDISFRYTADGPEVLAGVSLRARPGELVALVGPSGSGKSTCLRLLLGFEAPVAGRVLYDGRDLAGLDVLSVRRQLGVVLQEGSLLAGNLLENIVGSRDLGLDAAWEAAEAAGVAEEIRAMPMGLHTVVTEGADSFAGGQKQRLLLARALIHRPRVLLLDEATSALDNRAQARVAESLARLRATRIVVAHRLSTIRHADRIYVLDRGRVVEEGSYEELLARGGLFTRLVERQVA